MGTGIKGFKSQKILKSKLNGYTETESVDPERYVTIQELTGDKHGADVVIHGGFEVDGIVRTVGANSNIRVLKIVGHGAQKGDFVRFKLSGIEASVLSVPDADTIILGSELSFNPIGLELYVCRHITPSYNVDGSLNVLASQGPVQFNKDGSTVEVNEDTAVVANNKPLPSGLMIKKDDGNYYPVTLDTTNPYAHTPIPVAITDVTGTSNVTINAGDIQVGIKHNGADPSSVRIGDGTNLAAVDASNQLKVVDAQLHTDMGVAHTDLVNIYTRQADKSQFTKITDGTNNATVTVAGALKVDAGTISSTLAGLPIPGNTTTTPLGANATFTGTWTDLTDYNSVALGVYSDKDSDTDGLKYQFSSDGVNVHHEHSYTFLAVTNGIGYNVGVEFKYFRVVYTNGAVAQTSFSLISTAKPTALFPSQYKITQTISGQTQALFTRGVIVGETTAGGGGYVNVKVNPSGALTVDATVSSSALPTGAATETTLSALNSKITTTANGAKVDVIASALPTGAATSANQATANLSLASIDAKLPVTLGPQTIAGSLSVTPALNSSFNVVQATQPAGTILNTQLTVGVTAVRATTTGSAPTSGRRKLWIKPSKNNTGAIFMGASSVSIANGMEIIGPDRWEVLNDANDYYLISDTAGQVVEIIEVY